MISGVYIGKKNYGDYDLVSTGDYINPISVVFRLKDSGKSLEQINTYYLIFNDISVEFAKIKIVGQMTPIRLYLSWNKSEWMKEITIENINAIDTLVTKSFYVKFVIDDVLMYYNLKSMSNIKNYKLALIYN